MEISRLHRRLSAATDALDGHFDPTQPEQQGEFTTYRRLVVLKKMNPRGNDILKLLWGVSPGRSLTYRHARERRNDFACRLKGE